MESSTDHLAGTVHVDGTLMGMHDEGSTTPSYKTDIQFSFTHGNLLSALPQARKSCLHHGIVLMFAPLRFLIFREKRRSGKHSRGARGAPVRRIVRTFPAATGRRRTTATPAPRTQGPWRRFLPTTGPSAPQESPAVLSEEATRSTRRGRYGASSPTAPAVPLRNRIELKSLA